MERIRVGVSRCLTGDAVRYDGGHKRHPVVCDALARLFELVPVCPEVAAGLGVPRPPVRLMRRDSELRVVGAGDRDLDVTAVLVAASRDAILRLEGLGGFVLKSGSPSCGLSGVPLFDAEGRDGGLTGEGVFAGVLRQAFPNMPFIEETALNHAALRDDFVRRVRRYCRHTMV